MAVQSNVSSGTSTTTDTCAYSSNNTAGNVSIVGVWNHANTTTDPALSTSVTDTAGNTYTFLGSAFDNFDSNSPGSPSTSIGLWICFGIVGGANTVHVTIPSGTSGAFTYVCEEAASGGVRVFNSAFNGVPPATFPNSSPTVSLASTVNGDRVVFLVSTNFNKPAITAGLIGGNAATILKSAGSDQDLQEGTSPGGTINVSTQAAVTDNLWTIVALALKPAGSAPAPSPPLPVQQRAPGFPKGAPLPGIATLGNGLLVAPAITSAALSATLTATGSLSVTLSNATPPTAPPMLAQQRAPGFPMGAPLPGIVLLGTGPLIAQTSWALAATLSATGALSGTLNAFLSATGAIAIAVDLSVTGAETAASSGTIAPAVALAETGGELAATSAAIAPTVAVAATGAEQAAATSAIAPTIAEAATGGEVDSATAAIAPTVAVSPTGGELAATSTSIAPTIAVSASASGSSAASAAIATTVAVAATGAELAATTSAIAPTISVSPTGGEADSASASIGPTVAVSATGAGGNSVSVAIAPAIAVAATGAETAASSAAVAPSVALAPTGGELAAATVSVGPAVAVTSSGTAAISGSAAIAPTADVAAVGLAVYSASGVIAIVVGVTGAGGETVPGVVNAAATAALNAVAAGGAPATADIAPSVLAQASSYFLRGPIYYTLGDIPILVFKLSDGPAGGA